RRPSPRRARVRPRRARPASGGDRRAHRQGLRRTHARGRVHVALPVVPPARARHPVRRPRRPRRSGGGGMRDAFFRALAALGAADERVWALTGDLGVGLFEPFEAAAPGRYLNVGIAEQTLVGVAAGLAYAGKVPFSYSIAPFVTSRAHDQVRVDVACAGANVKLVGVGSGVSYGTLGPTHHAIDDIALTRVLPGMIVLAPGDPAEAERAARAAHAHEGPVYLRLGKNGEPALLPEAAEFRVGRAARLRDGGDVT